MWPNPQFSVKALSNVVQNPTLGKETGKCPSKFSPFLKNLNIASYSNLFKYMKGTLVGIHLHILWFCDWKLNVF